MAVEYDVSQMEIDAFGESPFIGITQASYDVKADVEPVKIVGESGTHSFRDKGLNLVVK